MFNTYLKSFLEKKSALDTRTKSTGSDVAENLLLMGGILAASTAVQYLAGIPVKNALKQSPAIVKERIPDLIESVGAARETPVREIPTMQNNAFYASGKGARTMFPDMTAREREKVKKYGLIAYGGNTLKSGVLAHEAGHASINQAPWYSISKINQNAGRRVGSVLGGLLASLTAADVGRATGSPVLGGVIGAGAGVLGSLPVLLNEMQASNRGIRGLTKEDRLYNLQKSNIPKVKKALNRALLTYAVAAMSVPALIGVVGGLYGRKGDKVKFAG